MASSSYGQQSSAQVESCATGCWCWRRRRHSSSSYAPEMLLRQPLVGFDLDPETPLARASALLAVAGAAQTVVDAAAGPDDAGTWVAAASCCWPGGS